MANFPMISRVRFVNRYQRRYEFFDESNNVLMSVEQAAGGVARGRLGRMFAGERDYSPVLLRFQDSARVVTFTLERRLSERHGGPGVAPILRTANGEVVGTVFANPRLSRDDPMSGEAFKNIVQERWRLLDDRSAVLCEAEQRVVGSPRWMGVQTKKVDYSDPEGNPVARFDGKWIEFVREVPVNLRMLVIASPVAFDLLDGA
ncbi:hypothetical protein AB0L25_05215 [Spirillospora sp. NPDC052242]